MATLDNDSDAPKDATYARRATLHYEQHPNKAHDLRMGIVAVLAERTVFNYQSIVGKVMGTDVWDVKMFARISPRTKLKPKGCFALYGVEPFTAAIARVIRVATPRGEVPDANVLDTLWLGVYKSTRDAFDAKREGDAFAVIYNPEDLK